MHDEGLVVSRREAIDPRHALGRPITVELAHHLAFPWFLAILFSAPIPLFAFMVVSLPLFSPLTLILGAISGVAVWLIWGIVASHQRERRFDRAGYRVTIGLRDAVFHSKGSDTKETLSLLQALDDPRVRRAGLPPGLHRLAQARASMPKLGPKAPIRAVLELLALIDSDAVEPDPHKDDPKPNPILVLVGADGPKVVRATEDVPSDMSIYRVDWIRIGGQYRLDLTPKGVKQVARPS